MDASSLATADHFENWEQDMKELQPSLDYKRVDMSLNTVDSIPRRRTYRKRGICDGIRQIVHKLLFVKIKIRSYHKTSL